MTRPLRPVLAPLLLLALGAGAAAQESVVARRLSDSVAVRTGPERAERVLYYFAPTAELSQGDELEQTGTGQSDIVFSARALVRLHGPAHVVLAELAPAGNVVDLRVVTQGSVASGERPMVVRLPGGARCVLQADARMDVRAEPDALLVRNTGGEPVLVVGRLDLEPGPDPPGGETDLLLERGQQVRLPLFDVLPPAPGDVLTSWSTMSVRHEPAYEIRAEGEALLVSRLPGTPDDALLRVGGVLLRVPPGSPPLRLVDPRGREGLLVRPPAPGPAARPPAEVSPAAADRLRQWYTEEQLRAVGYPVPPPAAGAPPATGAETPPPEPPEAPDEHEEDTGS